MSGGGLVRSLLCVWGRSGTTASSCCLSSRQRRWTCMWTAGAGVTWLTWPVATRMAGGGPSMRVCLGQRHSRSSSTPCLRSGESLVCHMLFIARKLAVFFVKAELGNAQCRITCSRYCQRCGSVVLPCPHIGVGMEDEYVRVALAGLLVA